VTRFFGSDVDGRAGGQLAAADNGALADAATLMARAVLHLMDLPTPIAPGDVSANASLIGELADCFAGDMACPLVRSLVPTGGGRSHGRVGIMNYAKWSEQTAAYPVINRVVWPTCDSLCRVRFIRDFFADRSPSKVTREDGACQIDTQCRGGEGEVCVGANLSGHGRCTTASARFIPAMSAAVDHDGVRNWVLHRSRLDPGDPVVCESRWFRRSLWAETFRQDDPRSFLAALITSICMCLGVLAFGLWFAPRARHEIAVQQLEGRCGEKAILEFGGVMLQQMLEREAARKTALGRAFEDEDPGEGDESDDDTYLSDDSFDADFDRAPASTSGPGDRASETTPLAR